MAIDIIQKLDILSASLEGDFFSDEMMKTLYATDASVYREMPLAVAMPKHEEDIKQLIHFASNEGVSLIPRAAGTSLAGQCVGSGIVVDVSRYMTNILEVNEQEQWVRVQAGVVRDELNHYLKPHGLFFGPNTSTANRAMIGGMVGNNSCGSYSIVYGTTRDHVLEIEAYLSDGSKVVFQDLTPDEFEAKCRLHSLEGEIYKHIKEELIRKDQAEEIKRHFPKPEIHRRNTGYAVDVLLASEIFTKGGTPFNFGKLLAGSEGTLAFITEIKIHVDPLPPTHIGLICPHFTSVSEALAAVPSTMNQQPRAVELMDKIVMDCTKGNLMYQQYRFFLEGEPEAVLIIEAGGESQEEVNQQLNHIEQSLNSQNLGYAFPRIFGKDIKKVWDLRKAGLGLLSNIEGDAKPVAVIEDTAVDVNELPQYIEEFTEMMKGYGQQAVYYAHAGAGELHLRPILNLKKQKDVALFREIGKSTAELVKKYQGSLSGEHGDGRVRAEFIPLMIGDRNYALLERIKKIWDPKFIFNPGKIVSAPPMDTHLRYEPEQETRTFDTILDFSETQGILRAVEKCNGSGDCRKSQLSGGTMCPSYMATRQEKDTTRARANILREFLTRSHRENPFSHAEIYEVMDLCLSCKGCTAECPSNVDMTALKAEFLYQYYQTHGVPLRARAIANIGKINQLASIIPSISNFFLTNSLSAGMLKSILGIAPERSMPTLHKQSLRKWYQKNKKKFQLNGSSKGAVYFFCDEFTNYNDAHIGKMAIELLSGLGYTVAMPPHAESGRAHMSKGLLKEARKSAMYNIEAFRMLANEDTPIVGVEPSAILSFRDEYPRLVIDDYKAAAKKLTKHAFLFEEFIAKEINKGNIDPDQFSASPKHILLHGHCHQKSLSSLDSAVSCLSLPQHYEVEVIPSGCCGMAGSFGYEKEHYDISMSIGELVLFPAVRKADKETLIAAAGTSCRHQIWDGTRRKALHPIEILYQAWKEPSH